MNEQKRDVPDLQPGYASQEEYDAVSEQLRKETESSEKDQAAPSYTYAGMDRQQKAKVLVEQYFNSKVEKTDKTTISASDIYVVWFAYTLGSWKCLLSTNVRDGMYYEVTYDSLNRVTYLDAYKKWENVSVRDGHQLWVPEEN